MRFVCKIRKLCRGEEEKEMLEGFVAREEGVVLYAAVSAKTGEGVEGVRESV